MLVSNPSRFHSQKETQMVFNMSDATKSDDWSYFVNQKLIIRRRTCTNFIPQNDEKKKRGRTEERCGCQRTRRQHSYDVTEGEQGLWDQSRDTIPACNNAYGRMTKTNACYIRCDIQTDPKQITQLMAEAWKMKEPELIMCIIGGAKFFKMNERLEREFINGIIQTVTKAEGWIVTTGFKAGVTQLVGEAIHNYKVVNPSSSITAIGCGKWGATRNRDSLLNKNREKNNKRISDQTREKGEQDLELNHSHFILLDDGTYYGYDIGDYRMRLVKAISDTSFYSKKSSEDKDEAKIPIVTVVVEGGADTLLTVYKDLYNDIPVVLIDGSGRAANLLAKFINRSEPLINRMEKEEDFSSWKKIVSIERADGQRKLAEKFHLFAEDIREGLQDIAQGSKTAEKNMSDLFHQFLYCLQPAVRSRIRIFSLESDLDLDDTIFEAIIQTRKMKSNWRKDPAAQKKLMKLALAWNAFEVAKKDLIQDDLSIFDSNNQKEIFTKALELDRPNFVNLFLKLKFDVADFLYDKKDDTSWTLNWTKLHSLYQHDLIESQRRSFLKKFVGNKEIDKVSTLDSIIKQLIGDYMKSLYISVTEGSQAAATTCFGKDRLRKVTVSKQRSTASDDDQSRQSLIKIPDADLAEEVACRDLFLWAVLTNRVDMAKVLLGHMKTRICSALVASKIYKSFLNSAQDNESKEILSSYAEEFENYACEALKHCYSFDEDKACEIAIRQIPIYGGVTCLQVAVDADDKKFVGQPCSDTVMDNVWYGNLTPLSYGIKGSLSVVFHILTFGLLAPILLNFRTCKTDSTEKPEKTSQPMSSVNETEEQLDTDEEQLTVKRLEERGINYSDNYNWRWDCCSPTFVNYVQKLYFFHNAPFVKFWYYTISYILFLLMFSYYLLFDFNPPLQQPVNIHWTEIFTMVMISTMFIEDVRQFLCQENRTFLGKLHNYFLRDISTSSVRVTSYLLYYIGLGLRYRTDDSPDNLTAAKIVLAYDIEIWFIRSLAFLSIAKKMGPKLVMIRKMIIDLLFFVYIIVIAMIGYGVASRAMFDFAPQYGFDTLVFDGRSIFRHIVYPTYYFIYGSTDSETGALNAEPDSGTAIATHVLLAFHLLFVNILLLNLLIAMFSFTFESVQSQTDLVWRYERYSLIREYFDRPILFPPLIFLSHLYEIFKLIFRCVQRRNRKNHFEASKTFKMIGAKAEINYEWSEFEGYTTSTYARSVLLNSIGKSNHSAENNFQKELSSNNMETLNFISSDSESLSNELVSMRQIVVDLRQQTEEMTRCMQWMMDAMERVKMSREPRPRLNIPAPIHDREAID